MSKFVRLPLIIFSILALSTIAFAQSTLTGGISGKVTDPLGASIPNAAVTATNAGTNQESTATSDSDGGFRVVNLPPGTYTVKVSVAGFADFVQEKIVVEVGQVTNINVPLGVAGTTATVEVTAEAPVINTNSQEFSTNINQTSINELPVNGRRVTDFVLLTPASVPDGPFGLISFRGISGLLNNSTVDGGDNNQSFQSEERGRTRIPYVVSQSAVREFQVNSSNYSAEYGRSAGAVVNTVSKSGTNEFHGDLFEYYRNNRFGARNPRAFQSVLINGISTPVGIKPLDIRHQFGGDIGGPIVKNKAFFFFSYDQQKRNFPGLAVFSVPSYLNTLAPGTTGRAALTAMTATKGLTNAQIDNALAFLTSTTGETPRRGDQKIIFPKFDWQVNSNNLFTLSYNRLRWASPAGLQTQATNTNARHSFGDDFVRVDTINSRFQSTLTPNLLNELRFQYSKDFEFALSQPPLPGEPSTATTELGARSPQVFLTNGLTFGTTTNFERIKYPDERRIQVADTVTWTKGIHTIKFGADINRVTDEILNRASEAGSYQYANISDFVIDYVNFVTPLPATVTCSTTTRLRGRCYTGNLGYVQGVGIQGIKFTENEYSFFAQLDTRITPRLTLNSGLRYEYQKLPVATLANPSTVVIPNDGRTLNQATSIMPNDKNNWGPRVGFAYDINGDGKTSVRGGFGVYYGRILGGHIWNNLLKTGNLGGQGTINAVQTQITNCFPLVATATIPCAPIFPNTLPNTTSLTSAGTIVFFQRNFQTPKILQYDFILEREIAKNTVASASFVGARGYDLPTFVDVNQALTGASKTYTILGGNENGQSFTVAQFGKAIPTQPVMLREESSVKSEYSALVLQVNRRFTNGLQFQSSYTFSKSTDTGQNSIITGPFNTVVDPFQRQAYDFGPTNFDTRHKFVFSAVYAPTLYKGGAGSARDRLLNGWSVSPIYVLYSGTPFSAVTSSNLNGSNGDNRYFRLPRNSFRLPAIKDMDLRVSKRINFSERYNVELLGEAFNLFNRTQVFGETNTLYTSSSTTCTVNGVSVAVPAPGNGLCFNPAFGAVSSTDSNKYSQRQIQFAVRFHF
ncbi:MAG TPA: TonB-dependent receptor [Pyrinomonadaceae bacterium]|nr:TonB-dependent receptor [Pyrinomonadaceae bacterium]